MNDLGDDFFRHVSWRARLAGGVLLVGVPGLAFVMIAQSDQSPPISETAVLGCYMNPRAPAISVEPGTIRLDQPELMPSAFEIRRDKRGFSLHVKAPISLRAEGEGYVFQRDAQGTGYFWRLLTVAKNGEVEQLENPQDFGSAFSVVAKDGADVIYRRVSADPCPAGVKGLT